MEDVIKLLLLLNACIQKLRTQNLVLICFEQLQELKENKAKYCESYSESKCNSTGGWSFFTYPLFLYKLLPFMKPRLVLGVIYKKIPVTFIKCTHNTCFTTEPVNWNDLIWLWHFSMFEFYKRLIFFWNPRENRFNIQFLDRCKSSIFGPLAHQVSKLGIWNMKNRKPEYYEQLNDHFIQTSRKKLNENKFIVRNERFENKNNRRKKHYAA